MTVPSVTYARYAPEQVKVDSLSIGVSHEFNETMSFGSNQFLAVGEFRSTDGEKAFNMIIDNEGVAIRTNIPQRATNRNEYALYVDGDVFVTGKLFASNVLGGGSNGIVVLGDGTVGNDPFWSIAQGGIAENLFYSGKVTLGNQFQSLSNQYTLNVSRSADSTIDHAQIAITNTQNSQIRMGVLGAGANSPAVINTPPGTKLEFHIGRDQSYFAPRYVDSNYVTSYDPNTGAMSTVLVESIGNNPNYNAGGNDVAPHIILDTEGNVGIRTSHIPALQYDLRQRDPAKPQDISYFPMNEPMALHVDGPFYGSNILMWDHEDGDAKHLDELYVRRKGVTLPANQINPGSFGSGYYSFVSNISIMGPIQEQYEFALYGDAKIGQGLTVDGTTFTNQLIANDAILLDVASFCNDMYVNRDIIVNQAIRLRGQIFVEVPSDSVTNGESNFSWRAINFSPAAAQYSNLNIMGQGISTPGRFGTGINPSYDEVNHQLAIVKRDPGARLFNNMFELELQDKSLSMARRAAYIGHPQASSGMTDGSLVIATPSANDTDYSGLYQTYPQNIYMFAGADLRPSAPLVLSTSNTPTLGVFHTKKVGVLTYNPRQTLDVRGSISFSDSLYYYDAQANQDLKIGLWKARDFININPETMLSSTYKGIIYQDTSAPHVGIMAEPNPSYSLNVGGTVKTDGYFNTNNRRLADWFDGKHAPTLSNHVSPADAYSVFTWGKTGVGVKNPQATLEVKDNFQSTHGTRIQLSSGDTDNKKATSITFAGSTGTYILQHDDLQKSFEMALIEHVQHSSNTRALCTKYNNDLQNYQVVIGCNLSILSGNSCNANPDPNAVLTVGGNMSVMGNVNITGEFKVLSRSIGSNDTVPYVPPVLAQDDVFLGGNHIVLQPSFDKTVCIGSPPSGILDFPGGTDADSFVRVYNQVPNKTVATFRSVGKRAMIQLAANDTMDAAGSKLKFGVIDATATNVPFAFMDGNDNPLLSFYRTSQSLEDRYFIGLNTNTPSASLHVVTSGYGSNMLKLTKNVVSAESTTSASPSIELSKSYINNTQLAPTRWVIQGPNAERNEKLSFSYSDNTRALEEVFCVTNEGCIGLNTPNPEFALDITNTGRKGSIRLLNTDNAAAAPQMIFQSGSREFGSDASLDFRMAASNNTFVFDMQNINNTFPLMHVNSNGHIGIRGYASSVYPCEVNGTLNVNGDGILLNGNSIFDGTGQGLGIAFKSSNILLLPAVNYNGGVTINKNSITSNLFYIYSGLNCNMMVLDSWHDEAQIHLRVQEGLMGKYNMWRAAASNSEFYMSYFPNCGNDLKVNSGKHFYSNVFQMGPSGDVTRPNEFNLQFWGQTILNSTAPSVQFDKNGKIFGMNSNMFILSSSNLGIGTTTLNANVHVYQAIGNSQPFVRIQRNVSSSSDILQVVQGASDILTVNATGNIGIGTTNARSSLHVASGQVFAPNGSSSLPGYSFNLSPASGLWTPGAEQLSVGTAGIARMNFMSNGNIQISSNVSFGLVTVASNLPANQTLFAIHQYGNGDVMRVSSTPGNNTSSFVVQSSGNIGIGTSLALHKLQVQGNIGIAGSIVPILSSTYDLGTENLRWRDVYISGNTLDIGGTKVSRETSTGNIILTNDNATALRSLVVQSLQIGDDSSPTKLIINRDTDKNITFTTINQSTGLSKTFSPLTIDESSTISIGNVTQDATLSLATATSVTITSEQNGTSNHAEFWTSGSLRSIIDNKGNIGIGTAVASSPLTVKSDGNSMATFLPFNTSFAPSVIDRSGNIGIHTTIPFVPLHVVGSNLFDGRAHFSSNIYIAGNVEVYGNTLTHGNTVTDSDLRLKKDLHRIDNALDKVCDLTGYTFTRIRDESRSTGLIAQDVNRVLPEAVTNDGPYLGLTYGNMVGLLVEAIKELRTEVNELKQRIA